MGGGLVGDVSVVVSRGQDSNLIGCRGLFLNL